MLPITPVISRSGPWTSRNIIKVPGFQPGHTESETLGIKPATLIMQLSRRSWCSRSRRAIVLLSKLFCSYLLTFHHAFAPYLYTLYWQKYLLLVSGSCQRISAVGCYPHIKTKLHGTFLLGTLCILENKVFK